jgi:CubicO group peptidase (beta-lactamase class C family)
MADIVPAMESFASTGMISGAVTLVARDGKIVHHEAVGKADLEKAVPMKKDSMFWVASMTKPIAATAIMILQDEGKLSVEDPVEKHLPEFKNQMLTYKQESNRVILIKPPRPITIRDLLTHTSGLNDSGFPRKNVTLAELVSGYARMPLKFPPGSKWEYCNSGINTLGRLVEVISGQEFEEFLQTRLFKPLGMKDTTFFPDKSQLKRIVVPYKNRPGGGLEPATIFFIPTSPADRNRPVLPAGGLFSTAEDMFRFYQLILGGGKHKGKRLLSEEAIAEMTKTQTGELQTGFTDGMSFGYGWAVVKQPVGVTSMLSKGTYGHGGAYGTQGWVDPEKTMIFVLMIQRSGLPNADASEVRREFQRLAVEEGH